MITYRSGYKYQLKTDYSHLFDRFFPLLTKEFETDFLWLGQSGGFGFRIMKLIIKQGYAWDGPSGPTIDTKNFMRGSLVHDALYQLIRLQYLDKNVYRIVADQELYRICREDGMGWPRASMVYYSLRVFGNPAARYSGENPILTAP
jgi:hypothetical protein